jgi:hypothetical protein
MENPFARNSQEHLFNRERSCSDVNEFNKADSFLSFESGKQDQTEQPPMIIQKPMMLTKKKPIITLKIKQKDDSSVA